MHVCTWIAGAPQNSILSVSSGISNGHVLGYYEGVGYTIRDAIDYWYRNVSDNRVGVAFRDECTLQQLMS